MVQEFKIRPRAPHPDLRLWEVGAWSFQWSEGFWPRGLQLRVERLG